MYATYIGVGSRCKYVTYMGVGSRCKYATYMGVGSSCKCSATYNVHRVGTWWQDNVPVEVGSRCKYNIPSHIHAVCRRWQSNGKNRWGLGSRGAYRHVLIRSDSRSRLLPGRVGMLGLLYYN